MNIDVFLPASAAKPGALRELYAYDLFIAELGAELGEEIILHELNLREIAPSGVALVHCLGDLAPLAKAQQKKIFAKTILLGASPSQISQLVENFSPAGIVELSAFTLWRQKRPIDVSYPGVFLRSDYFNGEKARGSREGFPYGVVKPNGENLIRVLGEYLRWLAAQ